MQIEPKWVVISVFSPFWSCTADSLHHAITAKEITWATSTDAAGAKTALSLQLEGVHVPDTWMCRYSVLRGRSKLTEKRGRDSFKIRFLHQFEFYTKVNGCHPAWMVCCPKIHLHCLLLNWVMMTSLTVSLRLHYPTTCQHLTDLTSHLLSCWKDSVLRTQLDAYRRNAISRKKWTAVRLGEKVLH